MPEFSGLMRPTDSGSSLGLLVEFDWLNIKSPSVESYAKLPTRRLRLLKIPGWCNPSFPSSTFSPDHFWTPKIKAADAVRLNIVFVRGFNFGSPISLSFSMKNPNASTIPFSLQRAKNSLETGEVFTVQECGVVHMHFEVHL